LRRQRPQDRAVTPSQLPARRAQIDAALAGPAENPARVSLLALILSDPGMQGGGRAIVEAFNALLAALVR